MGGFLTADAVLKVLSYLVNTRWKWKKSCLDIKFSSPLHHFPFPVHLLLPTPYVETSIKIFYSRIFIWRNYHNAQRVLRRPALRRRQGDIRI